MNWIFEGPQISLIPLLALMLTAFLAEKFPESRFFQILFKAVCWLILAIVFAFIVTLVIELGKYDPLNKK